MICDSDENRLQADNVLTYIVITIRDHIMNMDQKMAEVTQDINHWFIFSNDIDNAERGVVICCVTLVLTKWSVGFYEP